MYTKQNIGSKTELSTSNTFVVLETYREGQEDEIVVLETQECVYMEEGEKH